MLAHLAGVGGTVLTRPAIHSPPPEVVWSATHYEPNITKRLAILQTPRHQRLVTDLHTKYYLARKCFLSKHQL